MAPRKVITSQTGSTNPKLAWTAHWQGEEGTPWLHGYGRTEAEACSDFIRICDERAGAEAVERGEISPYHEEAAQ